MFSPRSSSRLVPATLSVSPRYLCARVAPVLLGAAVTACGAEGPTDPLTQSTSPVVTTSAPTTSVPTTPSTSITPPVTLPVTPSSPPVVVNPPVTAEPPASTNPAPPPAIPTGPAVPTPPPVIPLPPATTPSETSSEPESGEDTTPTSSSGETAEPPAPPNGAGFYTQNGALYDVNGTEFVMRGVNHAYTWFYTQYDTQQQFQNIAATGANTVRVVLATGDQWTRTSGTEVANIISWAKANKLVAMLEPHDSTGYGESEKAPHPEKMIEYWKSPEILDAIKGQEAYVLVNIANEAFGNNTSDEWQSYYTMAVAELRQAGIKHTLIVDAPNWGQDWDNCMRDGQNGSQTMTCDAQAVYNADPNHNTMFSVHMYDIYGTAEVVRSYFDRFLSKGLPFLVGEFASDHGSNKNVDEATIMSLSEQHGVGYLGWSWSGNGAGLESLDMTTLFNANNLTTWGDRLINGEDGLKQTGTPCSCFE